MGTFRARVASNQGIGAQLRLLELAVDGRAEFAFQAGQFVVVPVPTPPGEKPRRGFYTLASAEQARAVQLIVEHRPDGGPVSQWVSSRQVGGELELQGPQGKAGLVQAHAKPQALFCQPSGLASVRSLLLSSLYAGSLQPHHLFLGGGELVLAADWRRLAGEFPQFHLHHGTDLAALAAAALREREGLRLTLAGFNRDVDPLAAALAAAGFKLEEMRMERYG